MKKAIKDDPNSQCGTKPTEGKTDQVADVLLGIVDSAAAVVNLRGAGGHCHAEYSAS